MTKFKEALKRAYQFKPLRTFSQALAGLLGGATLLDVDWKQAVAGAGLTGLLSLLQITAEGGDLFADDKRVTKTKE